MNILNDYMNLPQVKFMLEHWIVFVVIFVILTIILLIKEKKIEPVMCNRCHFFWKKGTKKCAYCGNDLKRNKQ